MCSSLNLGAFRRILEDPTSGEALQLDVFRQLMQAVAAMPARTSHKCQSAADTLGKLALAVGHCLSRNEKHNFGAPLCPR